MLRHLAADERAARLLASFYNARNNLGDRFGAKLADGELIVIEEFGFEKPSTKEAAAVIKALGCEGRTTVVIADDDVNAFLSLRNLPRVNVIPVAEANTYELIDNKALVFTAAALARIEEVLA